MSHDNLSLRFLEEESEELVSYDGFCMELADSVMKWLDKQGKKSCLVYIDSPEERYIWWESGMVWNHHAVVLCDGLLHDAWHPEPLAVEEYLSRWLPFSAIDVEIVSDDCSTRKLTWRDGTLRES